MRKILASIISVTMIAPMLLVATPAAALCAPGVSLIGTISSVTNQGATSKISLDHRGRYDASSLPVDRTDIDAYQTLIKAYMQNADVVPPNLRPQESSLAPQGYASWEEYYSQNYTYISVPTDALSHVSYQQGDIVIVGPPGGATCMQYGFTGFFGKDGLIKSAIAYDSNLLGYTYGGEALTLSAGTDNLCTQGSSGTTCQVPIRYTLRGTSSSVNPGESKLLAGLHFFLVTLMASTHTTPPQNVIIEDFSPRSVIHVLAFRTVVATSTPTTIATTTPVVAANGETFSASPANGPASLVVTFNGKVSNNDSYTLDFGDKRPTATTRCAISASSSTSCQLTPVLHTYSLPGTYTAILTDVISGCSATSTSQSQCKAATQYRIVGNATVSVSEAQPKLAFKIFPKGGPAPLSVDFYGPTDSYTYSIDFGDGNQPSQYWGPTAVTTCKVRTGGPSGCIVATHAYMENGSYTARLSRNAVIVATLSIAVSSEYGFQNSHPDASCPIIYRTLARGARGASVTALQQYLVDVGLLQPDSISGFYGARTQAAVSQWQSEHGIAATGTVGPLTRSALATCDQ